MVGAVLARGRLSGWWTACGASLAFLAVMLTSVDRSWGDVVELTSGGVVRGTVLEDESDEQWVVVELESTPGAKVRVRRDQVRRILYAKDLEEEYQKRLAGGDGSLAHHLELARWCERYKMKKRLLQHLQQAARLDPENKELRLLAARNGLLDDLFPEQYKAKAIEQQGLVRDGGRLLTPQQKRLEEEREAREAREREWMKTLADLRRTILNEGPLALAGARSRLIAIDEAEAFPAVLRHFLRDERPFMRALGCVALYNIPDPRATEKLVEIVLEDPEPEVRAEAIDALKHRQDPLAIQKLTRALDSSRNERVRLAALALAEIGDESAVPALIDALITEHLIVRGRPNSLGAFSGAFIGPGPAGAGEGLRVPVSVHGLTPIVAQPVASGGGFGAGGPRVLRVRVANPEVHEALVKLTDQDFGYDEDRWKEWYISEQRLRQQRERRQLSLP